MPYLERCVEEGVEQRGIKLLCTSRLSGYEEELIRLAKEVFCSVS